MIETLKGWFESFSNWLEFSWWEEFKNSVWEWFKSASMVAALVGTLLTTVISLFDVGGSLEGLAGVIDGGTGKVATLPTGDLMSKLNRLFPLTETLSLLSFLFGLKIAALGIRIVMWLCEIIFQIAMFFRAAMGK